MAIVFTPTGNEAEDRRIRRLFEAGDLCRIVHGVYVEPVGETMEVVLRRNWPQLVARLVPDAVVTDRSGIEAKPVQGSDGGSGHIYVCAERSRTVIELPGLTIHVRPGHGPQEGDIPYLGTHIAGRERQVLDNLVTSRSRSGNPARTLGQAAIEAKLDDWCRTLGIAVVDRIREAARLVAPLLDREREFGVLDGIVDALLCAGPKRMLTPQGLARATGAPIDVPCVNRFLKLARYMQDRAPLAIVDADTTAERMMAGSFAEAYFSNFIEGVRFTVDEAREIALEGKLPPDRLGDARDVLGTYSQLAETVGPPPSSQGFSGFLDEIRSRHRRLMDGRPAVRPGDFKTVANRAGDTVFVAPDHLVGTLREGHAMMTAIGDPLQRALFLQYMLAETHPFDDGNGRVSRILMTRELLAAGLSRIVVPTIFSDDYIGSLRALSRRDDPSIFVRSMEFCQRVSAACSASSVDETINRWAQAYGFCEDQRQARLTMPNAALRITDVSGVRAPEDYWQAISGPSTGGAFAS